MSRSGPTGGWLPPNRLLQLIALVSTLDRFAMPPMIPTIARDLDIPLADVATAAGAYFLAYGLMQPIWGLIGGNISVVRLLRLASFMGALATTASVFAVDAISLAAARTLAGIGFSAAIPSALVYIGETATAEHRHREVANLTAGIAAGTAISTAGAGLLADAVGWRSAFLVSGAIGLVAWLAMRSLPELPVARAAQGLFTPLVAVLRSAPARTLVLLAAGEGAVLLGTLTFLPAAAEHAGASPALASAVTAVFGVAVLVLAPMVARLQRRIGPAALIAGGALCASAGCAVAAASARPLVVVPATALLGAAWAAMHSTLQTWATEVVPHARSAAVSLFACALFAGSALATMLGGGPADHGHFTAIFAVTTALALPLGFLGTFSRARWDRGGPRR